jgi:5'-nucleotidase
MNILLTNDDGVHSPGIGKLAEHLSRDHKVWIVAPGGERSASGHSITMNLPLFAKKITLPGLEHIPAYKVSGTPADSVKLGLRAIVQEKIDLVVSGINLGSNLGSDILCSGTTSAAMEAAVLGRKGLAASLQLNDMSSVHFLPDAAKCVGLFLSQIDVDRDIRQVINMNIPSIPFDEIKGFKFAQQGEMQYDEQYEKRTDPRGREYYWLAGGYVGDQTGRETDSTILREGYVALTPLKCDLTDFDHLESLKCNLDNLKLHI